MYKKKVCVCVCVWGGGGGGGGGALTRSQVYTIDTKQYAHTFVVFCCGYYNIFFIVLKSSGKLSQCQ